MLTSSGMLAAEGLRVDKRCAEILSETSAKLSWEFLELTGGEDIVTGGIMGIS